MTRSLIFASSTPDTTQPASCNCFPPKHHLKRRTSQQLGKSPLPIGAVPSGHRNLSFLFDDLSTKSKSQKCCSRGTWANHHVSKLPAKDKGYAPSDGFSFSKMFQAYSKELTNMF